MAAAAPLLSVSIAGLVVLPYYIAQLKYAGEVAPSFKTVEATALQLAFSGFDLINGFSQAMRIGIGATEGRLNWGIIPALLVVIGLVTITLRQENSDRRQTRLFGRAAAIYLGYITITLGSSLVAAEMFYYGVPILGSMHIFQRYLIFGQLFFALMASCGVALFVRSATPTWRGILLSGGLVAWFGLSLWLTANRASIGAEVDVGRLLSELFISMVAVCVICIGRPRYAILGMALLSSVVSYQVSLMLTHCPLARSN